MKRRIIASLYFSISFLALIWLIFVIDLATPFYLSEIFGVQPRNFWGVPGIFFHPFLHDSLDHIFSNSRYLFPLLFILFLFHGKLSTKIVFYSTIIPGILLLMFGRPGSHIGASGLVFALMGFLIVSGLFKKSLLHIALSIGLFVVYGSIIYINITTFEKGLSTEGHIFGLIVGMALAYDYRKEPILLFNKLI